MDNKQVLQFILTTDQLLNNFGDITRMENKHERRRERFL